MIGYPPKYFSLANSSFTAIDSSETYCSPQQQPRILHALREVEGVAAFHDQSSAKPLSVWRNVFLDPSNGSVT